MRQVIKDYIEKEIVGQPIAFGDNESLFDRDILTSLGIIQLTRFLQEEQNIPIDIDEIVVEDFETIDNILALLARLKK